ncbi:MAG: hypothetical protein JW881_02980 [Spirochaetales bacterium]|nr:hypothetical protein [Spirochaetales bacterium]
MKLTILTYIIISGLCLCTSSRKQAVGGGNISQPENLAQPAHNKTGAFEAIDTGSAIAVKTFAFLKETLEKARPHLSLHSVKEAESQVVQGVNIRLVCEYSLEGDDTPRLLRATVYWDPGGNPSLTEASPDDERDS